MKIAMVIPTIRKFEKWDSFKKEITNSAHDIDVYTCGEEEDVNPQIDKVLFSSPRWREKEFGKENLWLFPPFTRHVNSIYAYIIKHAIPYDVIITVDDDVECSDGFFDDHIKALEQQDYPNYESMFMNKNIFPRGFPYGERKYKWSHVGFNHGLWSNIADLNAIDYVNGSYAMLKEGFHIAHKGKAITVSSMNVAFRSWVLPIYYQPVNFTRHDDIWSGLIVKRIFDHCGYLMAYGNPIVRHNKFPRNIWEDNKKEANGHEINESIWKDLQKITFKSMDIFECYKQIVEELPHPEITKYMKGWIKLIEPFYNN